MELLKSSKLWLKNIDFQPDRLVFKLLKNHKTNTMQRLKVGLIGLGRIGKLHLENLVFRIPSAEVVAVSDPLEATHDFARKLGVKEIYTDAPDVILHKAVKAIIICSPTHTHSRFILATAKAEKHIFCEKPLDMTVAAIEKILEVLETYKVKLQVGFNRRFDANFSKVQRQVKNGKIGQPHILKITSRDPNPPPIEYIKLSGGMFMDMSIHDFDMARFIVGSEVEEVFAKAAVLVDKKIGTVGDIDTAIITLKFANGCLGVIDNSRAAVYGYDQRLEIFGSKGMSRVNNNYADNEVLYDERGTHKGLPLNFFMDRYTEAYCREMKDFIRAIRENKPISVDGKDALMATKNSDGSK